MSGVSLTSPGAGGFATRGTLRFTDDFNRANSTFAWGPNWTWAGFDYQLGAFSMFGPIGITTNQAEWQSTAVNQNILLPIGWQPIPIATACLGKSQFSQIKFVSSNALQGTRLMFIGPSVGGGYIGSDYKMYILVCVKDDINNKCALVRFDNGVFTTLQNFAAGTCQNGDTIRLEMVVETSQVTLNCYQNGVLLGAIVDNGGNQARNGIPGVHRFQYTTGATPGTSSILMDDYSGGTL